MEIARDELGAVEAEKISQDGLEPALRSRDALATCPTERRGRYAAAAGRADRQRAEAIKLKCLDCCCWQEAEVRRCDIRDCALWPLRPYRPRG